LAVGVAPGLAPEPIGFGVEAVGDGNPKLGRQLAGEADIAQRRAPVPPGLRFVLKAVQFFGVDGPHSPVAGLLLERLEALPPGHLEQFGR
jgi:hypothetical protein